MAIGSRQFHNLVLVSDRVDDTDGELLERFVSRGDRTSLDALVGRHAPMVWGVCARLLGRHDAEDAFQATFLVLVRRAAAVRPRELVGNWLYGVARQTALNVRRQLNRRRIREVQASDGFDTGFTPGPSKGDLLACLDRELNHLPSKYRSAIVLCDLEGLSRKEAARHLGLPEGTVASRQARGKALLASRLARHGLAVAAAVLEAALVNAADGLPAAAADRAIRNVSMFASGQLGAGVVSNNVLNVTERVVHAMFLSKLKFAGIVLLAAVLATAGTVAVGYSVLAGEPPRASNADQAKIEKPAPAKSDLDLLQGEWQVVEADTKGAKTTDEGLKEMRFVFDKDNLSIASANRTGRERKKTFKLDASKSPKELDMTSLDGAEKDEVAACIYKLEKDRLTICMPYWNKDPGNRPTDFKATAEDGRMVMVLERISPQPPAKAKPAAAAGDAAGDLKALQQAKLDAAKEVYDEALKNTNLVHRVGNASVPNSKPEEVYLWSVRWLNAENDLRANKEARIMALEAHIKRMMLLSDRVERMSPEFLPKYEVAAAKWYVAEAKLWLAKEKAR